MDGSQVRRDMVIDRVAHRRVDEAWLAAHRADPRARVLPIWRDSVPICEGDPPALAWGWVTAMPQGPDGAAPELIFLGLADDGTARFTADTSDLAGDRHGLLVANATWVDQRRLGARAGVADVAVLAYARGLIHWHRRTRFCGRCGAPSVARQGGHLRVCTSAACGETLFPRTDPVVIMLVTGRRNGEDVCLLGRQLTWPKGLLSTLAGFVEPGETLEQAVAREVAEEVGLAVSAVRYLASQPWPYPHSLMLGFRAEATAGAVVSFDRAELEHAAWYSRAAIARFAAEGLRLPYSGTIARALIDGWLAEGMGPREATMVQPPW